MIDSSVMAPRCAKSAPRNVNSCLPPPDAHPEDKPPLREEVQGGRLLGHDDRVALGQHQHRDPKVQTRDQVDQRGERDEGLDNALCVEIPAPGGAITASLAQTEAKPSASAARATSSTAVRTVLVRYQLRHGWQKNTKLHRGPPSAERSGFPGHRADGNQAATSAANAARTAAGVWWPWRSMSHSRL